MKKIARFFIAFCAIAVGAFAPLSATAQALVPSPCGAILCLEGSPVLGKIGGQGCTILTEGFFALYYGNSTEDEIAEDIAARTAYLAEGNSPGITSACPKDVSMFTAAIIAKCGTAQTYSACGGR